MTYGLEILSANNNLAVISDKSSNLIYIGKATYLSNWSAHGLSDTILTGGRSNRRNYWQITYRIVSNERPTVYASALPGIYVGVECIWKESATTWLITVGVNGYQFSLPYLPVVYCFSKIPSNVPPKGYGLAVYREDGSLAFDSSNDYKYLQISNIFIANIPQICGGIGGNGSICTAAASAVITEKVPTNFAVSYSMNAKCTQHANSEYGTGSYNLALGTYDGGTSFVTSWFYLYAASYQEPSALFDAAPRVVTFIDTSVYA